MSSDSDRHKRALQSYKAHRGVDYVAPASPHDPQSIVDLATMGLDRAYGDSWSRPGLDFRTKSFVTMTVAATLGTEEQLRIHIAAAHRLGISKDELVEWLIHLNGYIGIMRTNVALRIARDVWAAQAEHKP